MEQLRSNDDTLLPSYLFFELEFGEVVTSFDFEFCSFESDVFEMGKKQIGDARFGDGEECDHFGKSKVCCGYPLGLIFSQKIWAKRVPINHPNNSGSVHRYL